MLEKSLTTNSILIIQTAFIGDVILATSLIESLKASRPELEISFLLRKGNEDLLKDNPHIEKIFIWDKSQKTKNLFKLIKEIRMKHFDYVFNIQRFLSSGLITTFSGAHTIGFDKNPLSFLFDQRVEHQIPDNGIHEIERNLKLIRKVYHEVQLRRPKLYFNPAIIEKVKPFTEEPYIVMAPTSVWFTKQWALSKWTKLLEHVGEDYKVYLIGAPSDHYTIESLVSNENHINLAGKLTLRESAYLMAQAKRVFVNDSAPLHLASSVNAKTTAIFCSTVPAFGYFPLSEDSKVFEVENLDCRPCGLHGHKSCPQGHFLCANKISAQEVFNSI